MDQSVTVLGMGRMGSALASAFVRAGHPVNVWNRSPHRCAPLVEMGATALPSIADAVKTDVIVVCLRDAFTAHAVLEETTPHGTVVQLTTGTAEDARRGARWAEERGAAYLDGAILCGPAAIGTDGAMILLSGRGDAFAAVEPVLRALGAMRHVGDEIGRANTLDTALLTYLYGGVAAFMQAAALCEASGVGLETIHTMSAGLPAAIGKQVDDLVRRVTERDYEPDVATLDIHAAAVERAARFAREGSLDPTYIVALARMFRDAADDGHADEGLAAGYEAFRGRR